ncbi:MAG: hypothetical protein ACREIV_07890 [Planctomycetaceae bacterium]
MESERIAVKTLTAAEQRRLGDLDTESAVPQPALLISGPRPVLSAIEQVARRIAWEEEQGERLMDVLAADPAAGVLPAARVLQLRQQAAAREQFLAEYDTLTSQQVAEQAGSTASNTAALANRWKNEGKIFALPVGAAGRYPAFQFGDDGRPLPVVAAVRELFADWTPWSLVLWLTSPSGWLDDARPVDLLVSDPARVEEAARRTLDPLDL